MSKRGCNRLTRFFANAKDRVKLNSGAPQEGLAISAGEQLDAIQTELLKK